MRICGNTLVRNFVKKGRFTNKICLSEGSLARKLTNGLGAARRKIAKCLKALHNIKEFTAPALHLVFALKISGGARV